MHRHRCAVSVFASPLSVRYDQQTLARESLDTGQESLRFFKIQRSFFLLQCNKSFSSSSVRSFSSSWWIWFLPRWLSLRARAMTLEPEGLGRALRDISIAFLILTWAIVAVRLAIRFRIKFVGADDYSMVGGLVCSEWLVLGLWMASQTLMIHKVLFTVVCTATIVSSYYGIGARDSRLTPELNKQARKVDCPWATIDDRDWLATLVPSFSTLLCRKHRPYQSFYMCHTDAHNTLQGVSLYSICHHCFQYRLCHCNWHWLAPLVQANSCDLGSDQGPLWKGFLCQRLSIFYLSLYHCDRLVMLPYTNSAGLEPEHEGAGEDLSRSHPSVRRLVS